MSYTKQQTALKKKEMIKALIKALGVITLACEKVGIKRSTHYDWYKADIKYKAAVDDIAEVTLDFAESMLHKQIQDKDTIATIFFLKTKGKKRGYIETQQLDLTNNGNSFNTLSDDELIKRISKLIKTGSKDRA